jgi:hypothetical protein
MLHHAVETTKLLITEAIHLYEVMYQETGQTSSVLMKILPLLANPEDARTSLMRVTKDNRLQKVHIKQTMGSLLKIFSGAVDGYYSLNLNQESTFLCLRRLLEISETLKQSKMRECPLSGKGRCGDTSHRGDWSCFRNEMLNSKTLVSITIGVMYIYIEISHVL